jgi:hypothetical protein
VYEFAGVCESAYARVSVVHLINRWVGEMSFSVQPYISHKFNLWLAGEGWELCWNSAIWNPALSNHSNLPFFFCRISHFMPLGSNVWDLFSVTSDQLLFGTLGWIVTEENKETGGKRWVCYDFLMTMWTCLFCCALLLILCPLFSGM